MGQSRSVQAYKLIAAGTVEEKIQALQARKRELFRPASAATKLRGKPDRRRAGGIAKRIIAVGPRSSRLPFMEKTYACIMAGGSGERFWPLSRIAAPKHLVRLLSEQTLLEETVKRIERALPSSHIFVLTNAAQIKGCRARVPHLSPAQFIAEPAKRDTAPACALGTALVRRLDPEAVVVFLPADALIKDAATFAKQLKAASALAARAGDHRHLRHPPRSSLHPLRLPGSGQGAEGNKAMSLFRSRNALSKSQTRPGRKPITRAGHFFWNAGIFLWKAATFMKEARRSQPELARFIDDFPSGNRAAYLAKRFPKLPKISVDYAIMEKAKRIVVAEARFDWDDVGSWTALPAHLPADAHGNTLRGVVAVHDSRGNIVFAQKRVIALCGVRDLIVVETDDAILVCHRDAAEQIKHLQAHLPDEVR